MDAFFAGTKQRIHCWLDIFLEQQSQVLAAVNEFGSDLAARLASSTGRGKVFRGCLTALGQAMYAGETGENGIIAGSAMELFQAALLIHDDIMDQDDIRRGMPSMHSQYTSLATERRYKNPRHTGESLAICAGDAAIFLGFNALSLLDCDAQTARSIHALCSAELAAVALAQITDVAHSVSADLADEADIEKLYVNKTGRYTFSMPLSVGAILGGASREDLDRLDAAGAKLGILFQLKDDDLGLFGDENHTGKSVGSDIREGKQTLYYVRLMKVLSSADSARIGSLFGREELTPESLSEIQQLVEDTGIRSGILERCAQLKHEVDSEIDALQCKSPEYRSILKGFARYLLDRLS